MHDNPVRKGLVEKSECWLYSSARNYILNDDSVLSIERLEMLLTALWECNSLFIDSTGDSLAGRAGGFKSPASVMVDYYRHQDATRRAMEHVLRMNTDTETHQPDIKEAVCECVYDLMPTLKNDYSRLLMRVDLEGASIAEVASEMSMTANNVRVKLHRARKALGKQLQLSCGSSAEQGCLDCDCPPSP